MKQFAFLFSLFPVAIVLIFPLVSEGSEDWFDKGNAHFDAHEYAQAVGAYTKALEETPQLVEAYLNRGLAYDNLEQPQKAIADFTQAIAIRPKYTEAFFYRGLAHYNMNQSDNAIKDLNKAIAMKPMTNKKPASISFPAVKALTDKRRETIDKAKTISTIIIR